MQKRVFVLFGILVVSALAIVRADRFETPPDRKPFAEFPMQIGNWRGVQHRPFDDKVLKMLGLTDYLSRAYCRSGSPCAGPSLGDVAWVDLYVGYWSSQRQGETIHSPQNCLPGDGWEPVSQRMLSIPDPRGAGRPSLTVNRYLIMKGGERQLVLYWFQSHDRIVASEYWSKFYLVADAVRMNRSDGAVVRIVTPIANETAGAEQQAENLTVRFVHDLVPGLAGFLPN